MSNQVHPSSARRLAIAAATSTLLGLGAAAPAIQAADAVAQPASQSPLMLAATEGMERRQDRRDSRQDCRQEEGLVGKDKRDCKQERRDERHEDDEDKSEDKDENEDKS